MSFVSNSKLSLFITIPACISFVKSFILFGPTIDKILLIADNITAIIIRAGAYSRLLHPAKASAGHRGDHDRLLYAHGRGEALPAPAPRAGCRRACGQFCPCRGMGGAPCASCHHPRQRVLGSESADGAVQSAAGAAAGWCTDGSVYWDDLAAKIRKVHIDRRKRLQNRHIWGKIKRTQKTDCLWRTRCLIPN